MILNKTLTVLPFLAVAAAVLVSACGGGDTGGAGGALASTSTSAASSTSTSGTASSTSTSTSSTSGSSTSTSTSTSSGGMMGACNNTPDKTALMDQAADKTAAQACGTMCVADAMPPVCAKNCMVMKLKITDGCGACWGTVIDCGIKMCFAECIGGASAKCDTCTMTKCEPAFHTCSGV